MINKIETADIVKEVEGYITQSILLGASNVPLRPEDSFLQKGILDSTGVLELVAFLEGHYGFICQDDEITPENLDTLNSIAAYVQGKLTRA